MGMNNRQFTDKENQKKLFKTFNKVYRTGESTKEFDWQVIRKDGTERLIEVSVSLQKNPSGQPIGFQGIARDITDRKKVEESLKKSEDQYRLLADNITEHVWLMDLNTKRTIFVSPSVEKMYGYTSDEIIKLSFKKILTAESLQKILDWFSTEMPKTLANSLYKPRYSLELEACHKDGHLLWIENTLSIIRDKNGKPALILGETRDITEQKKAEKKLQESEKYFKEITENSSDIIIITDKSGKIKYCSRSIERFTGYKPEELIGRIGITLIHPDDVKRALGDYGKVILSTDSAIPNSFRIVRKDGAVRYFEGLGKNLLDNEAVEGFIMNVRDITERKQIEEKLHREEQRFRAFVENSSDIIVIINLEGIITYINPAVERVLGFKPEERIGAKGFELVHPDDMQFLADSFNTLAGDTNSPVIKGEMHLHHKDGSWRTFEGVGSNMVNNNFVEAIIVNYRDITERKRAEELLKESENKYRLLAENIQDVVFVMDMNLNYSYLSPSVKLLRGYEPEEAMKHTPAETLTPSSMDLALRILSEMMEMKKSEHRDINISRTAQLEMTRKDGTTVWVETKSFFLRDENQRPVGIMGVTRDITERRQAESQREAALDALRKSEDKYRTLIETTDTGYVIIDQDGLVRDANSEYVRLTGHHDLSEIVGRSVMEWTAESEKERNAEAVTACFDKGYIRNLEINYVDTKGNVIPIEINATCIEIERKIFTITICRDITERKKAEDKLQQTLESLRKAIGTTIQVLISAVESRDSYTAGHQSRSANLACAIATEMGLAQDKIEGILMAGIIHDIGKLSIPAEILSKPTKLKEIEFSLIKVHSQSGYEMLKDVESPWPLAEIVYQHHERMNGSGYPRNLKGDEILIESQILAVADVVEAMASHRPYRPTLGIEAALEEIEKNKGILYDNAVADACLKLFREKGYKITLDGVTNPVGKT